MAVHIKEQEAGSLIQETCRGRQAMPQRKKGGQQLRGGRTEDTRGMGMHVAKMLKLL